MLAAVVGQAAMQFRHARGGDLLAQGLGAWAGLKLFALLSARCPGVHANRRLWRAARAGDA